MKILLSLALVLVLGLTLTPSKAQGYQPGDKALNFNLKNVDGRMVSLGSDPAAKGYIVVFTCNTCPVAQSYEDRVIALHQRYASLGYPVVAINPNDPNRSAGDDAARMKQRAEAKKYGFAYLTDATQEVARAYGALRTPHVYVVQRVGSDWVVRYVGAIDNNAGDPDNASKKYVAEAVDALLADRPVPTATTKAVGCGIKWKTT